MVPGKSLEQRPKYRDQMDFLENHPFCALHLQRCLDGSNCGIDPEKKENGGRCGITRAVARAIALSCTPKAHLENQWVCWLSHETLAHQTYLSVSAVKRAIRLLVSQGYLKRFERKNSSNLYVIPYRRLQREAIAHEQTKLALREEGLLASSAERAKAVGSPDHPDDDFYGGPGITASIVPEPDSDVAVEFEDHNEPYTDAGAY